MNWIAQTIYFNASSKTGNLEMNKIMSFEELHLDFKAKGLVQTEQETEAALILFEHKGLLEKQVFPDTNTIYYRMTGKKI